MVAWVVAGAAVLGAAGSLAQSNSQIKQLKQQAAVKNLEADTYERNARAQADADAYNEDVAREQRDIELSRLRTATAQSGVSGGTLIDVQMRSEQQAAMDDLVTRYNNHTKYVATRYEAQKARYEARQLLNNAKSMKKTRWLSAIIGGTQSGLNIAAAGGYLNGSGNPPLKDVTDTAGSGGNVTFTNASYQG